MTNWPVLGIMLLTYDRIEYALKTIEALRENLQYSGEVIWHLADDGSPESYRERLLDALPEGTSVTNSERKGYGASYNLASQVLHAKAGVILPMEDDWELTRPFSIDSFVQTLLSIDEKEEHTVSCVRMGYIGYTQPLTGTFIYHGGQQYLLFDPESKEPHVWAGHPRLETVERQKEVGPWPEGENAGQTEFIVAARSSSRRGVVWPIDSIWPRGDLFAHIGAVQARNDQRKEAEIA